MNKNIIAVGAMAVGLYLLAQANKTKKAVSKKKAQQKIIPGSNKRKTKKPLPRVAITHTAPKRRIVAAKKKTKYNKPKIKKAIARKKATYTKPKIKKATTRKKPTYYSPKSRTAIARKQQIKRMLWRKRRR